MSINGSLLKVMPVILATVLLSPQIHSSEYTPNPSDLNAIVDKIFGELPPGLDGSEPILIVSDVVLEDIADTFKSSMSNIMKSTWVTKSLTITPGQFDSYWVRFRNNLLKKAKGGPLKSVGRFLKENYSKDKFVEIIIDAVSDSMIETIAQYVAQKAGAAEGKEDELNVYHFTISALKNAKIGLKFYLASSPSGKVDAVFDSLAENGESVARAIFEGINLVKEQARTKVALDDAEHASAMQIARKIYLDARSAGNTAAMNAALESVRSCAQVYFQDPAQVNQYLADLEQRWQNPLTEFQKEVERSYANGLILQINNFSTAGLNERSSLDIVNGAIVDFGSSAGTFKINPQIQGPVAPNGGARVLQRQAPNRSLGGNYMIAHAGRSEDPRFEWSYTIHKDGIKNVAVFLPCVPEERFKASAAVIYAVTIRRPGGQVEVIEKQVDQADVLTRGLDRQYLLANATLEAGTTLTVMLDLTRASREGWCAIDGIIISHKGDLP